jgi:hypothetical protein
VGKRLAGLSLGIALALALVEVGIRLLPSSVLGFRYQDGLFLPPHEYERQTSRNALGVHDVAPPPKPPGRRRVLLLGDSYVAAISVPVEQGVARRLAHHLEQRAPGRYDVVSLSSEGWGQREELAALVEHGARLDPDPSSSTARASIPTSCCCSSPRETTSTTTHGRSKGERRTGVCARRS